MKNNTTDQEVLVESLYGCWEGHMAHALDRKPVDICHQRNRIVTGTIPIRPKMPEGVTVKEYNNALTQDPSTIDERKFGKQFLEQLWQRAKALELAEQDARNARRCGYTANWILHPDQIVPIQRAWTPTRERAVAALNLAAAYTQAAHGGSGAEVNGNRLADKAVVGTDWWIVRAALKGDVLAESDIKATGFTLQQLERTIVTHDYKEN